jgi:hypothetical protein
MLAGLLLTGEGAAGGVVRRLPARPPRAVGTRSGRCLPGQCVPGPRLPGPGASSPDDGAAICSCGCRGTLMLPGKPAA